MQVVFDNIEAAELLIEADACEEAAALIINATPLLSRWGFGRFLESLYKKNCVAGKKRDPGRYHS